jgi:hypothetical protein
VDTSTIETIETGLKAVAASQSAGSTTQDALQWLRASRDEWLILFDNADDPEINLNKWLPQCNHGNIVITSRNPGLVAYAGSHSLVSDMEELDAVELLLKSAGQQQTPETRKISADIVKVAIFCEFKVETEVLLKGTVVSSSGHYPSWCIHLKVWGTGKLLGTLRQEQRPPT